MRTKWRRFNARKKALLTLLVTILTAGLMGAPLICFLCDPFTPAQALRQYEQEYLYGPSEIVGEFPLALPPEEYRGEEWETRRLGGHAYLCRYEDYFSLVHLYPAWKGCRWMVCDYSLFPDPEDNVPAAAKYQFYTLLHGTLSDTSVTRLTVYGMYDTWDGGAFYHTEEAAILPDGHFALALDSWQFLCDGDHPLTLTGYGADGSVRFTADVYPPYQGLIFR